MTTPDRDDGFYSGDCVRILGSKVIGFVVGCILHSRREPAYFVEYVDAQGNPQERTWDETQLSLVSRRDDADAEEVELTGTVIPFPVAN